MRERLSRAGVAMGLAWTAAGGGPRNGPSPLDTHVSTLTPTGDDLILSKRLEGAFSAAFDLRRFPFDQQGLSITLAFNCANEGRTPVGGGLTQGPQG